jgi:uncharacterized Zn finger protein
MLVMLVEWDDGRRFAMQADHFTIADREDRVRLYSRDGATVSFHYRGSVEGDE